MSKKPIVKSVAVHYKQPKRETLSLKTSLEKKASNDVAVSRIQMGAQGVDGLKTMSGSVIEHCQSELKWPQCLKTYQQMSLDPTVAAVLNFFNMMIARAEFKFVAPVGASAESLAATEFLNYCMLNMEEQTWQQFLSGIGTYRIYGFSIAEKIWTTVTTGKFKGRLKWKSLSPRAQDTVKKWTWDKRDPERLTGVVQQVNSYDTDRYGSGQLGGTEKTIDRNKFLLFRFDPQKNNPQGTSPLDGCWFAWKYLQVIREYEAIGIGKDLGGIPVIGVPVEKIIEAANDPTGNAAKMITALQTTAKALHAGDSSFVMKPIDYDDAGNSLYTFDLAGVTGGGKQYDTSVVIGRYQNEILTVYSASMLKLGQESSGSFALSDNMNNMLAFGVEHNLKIIVDQINNDLVPQTLAINGWLLNQEDQPYLMHKDVTPMSTEELSKGLQRLLTSGAMSASKEMDKYLHNAIGIPEPTYTKDEIIPEEFLSTKKSAASQSNDGTGGTGSSQSVSGGDNNLENTA